MINPLLFSQGITPSINYEMELEANSAFLLKGAIHFNTILQQENVKGNTDLILSPVRSAELLNSATEDIIRYALYHPITKNKNGLLLISESVRAAYLTKWIMIFKPLNMDQGLGSAPKIGKIESATRENNALGRDVGFNLQFFCNEYFALSVASAILLLKLDEKLISIPNYLEKTNSTEESKKNEINSLLYNLRYRIKHQDVYHLFYNRLLHCRFPVATPA